MKISRILNSLILATLVAGCHRETTPVQSSGPKVEGDKITFATNAPELGYLSVEPAQERTAAAVGLYGRLAWNDNVTVRVYSPVAGRVTAIPVEVNQRVAVGDALA